MGTISGLYSQSKGDLRNLALSSAQISKLDWILLKAKVDRISGYAPLDPVAPSWTPEYAYDLRTDRIAAFVDGVDPSVLSMKDADRHLWRNAMTVCVELFSQPELRQLDQNTRCYVRFSTFEFSGGSVQRKLIATYENGKLKMN